MGALTWLSSAYIGMSWNGETYFPSAFSERQWRRTVYEYVGQIQAAFICLMARTECPAAAKSHHHVQWIAKRVYRFLLLLTFTSGWRCVSKLFDDLAITVEASTVMARSLSDHSVCKARITRNSVFLIYGSMISLGHNGPGSASLADGTTH